MRIFLLALLASATACDSPTTAASESSSAAVPRTGDEAADSNGVTIELPENGVPMNEIFAFDVQVAGPLPDDVQVDADMPAHGHGMLSKPVTTRAEDGSYHVEGMLLHMPGSWVIFVDVTRDGATERSTFPLDLDF